MNRTISYGIIVEALFMLWGHKPNLELIGYVCYMEMSFGKVCTELKAFDFCLFEYEIVLDFEAILELLGIIKKRR